MLRLLEVQNLALIDNLAFYPGKGLNVITGETGAGKSMLLGAVSLLLGERATSEAIRSGQEAAVMQAVFTPPPEILAAHDLTAEEEGLSLCREIRRDGPNICRINGRVQPLAAMSAAGRALVDLHGQNRQQSLLDPETQRELLDSFGGEALAKEAAEVRRQYGRLAELNKLVTSLGSDDASLAREADFLQFQLTEIEEAALSVEEEEELTLDFQRLTHARTLLEKTASLYSELYEGAMEGAVVDRLGAVEKELASAASLDESLSDILDNVASATQQLTEAARELRAYHDSISLDDARLQEVTQRLETYKKITKKYGPTVDDVLALAAKLSEELQTFQARGEKLAEAEREAAAASASLEKKAAKLSVLRQKAAAQLSAKINEALQSLALPGAQFAITVEPGEKCGPTGCDKVEFIFAANPGEPQRALAKTASGGEISRVMLAIKSVLAQQDLVPTLIFDEIDAGIGGLTIRSVADKLWQLAQHRQVICVTHQPLIAAAADHHFTIYKEASGKRTVTRLRKLEHEQRENELSRMLGGEEGVALQHAKELLNKNKK
ncbi:DNA repair protein RecN [Dethiobacter alkaliphilus]|uniref:DNA repair protein RecN n=1 Tax=Dethiobacter alkaliphilus AHT 1 TaxID=555088 RepID=C0GE18_DETAL|nr:DNA repair protein RecN [Dethiobacter alkaliphilus]EEG78312.1 DNA repair protein RecN [Dethiobacter alkaliphilus AHT 1]